MDELIDMLEQAVLAPRPALEQVRDESAAAGEYRTYDKAIGALDGALRVSFWVADDELQGNGGRSSRDFSRSYVSSAA